MGQYHLLVNVDKKQLVNPHGLGLGLKQVEQSGFRGSLGDAMYLLMMTSPHRGGGDLEYTKISGAWAGDRVLIVGDYTEATDIPSIPSADNLYFEARTWKDITEDVATAMETVFNISTHEDEWESVGTLSSL